MGNDKTRLMPCGCVILHVKTVDGDEKREFPHFNDDMRRYLLHLLDHRKKPKEREGHVLTVMATSFGKLNIRGRCYDAEIRIWLHVNWQFWIKEQLKKGYSEPVFRGEDIVFVKIKDGDGNFCRRMPYQEKFTYKLPTVMRLFARFKPEGYFRPHDDDFFGL